MGDRHPRRAVVAVAVTVVMVAAAAAFAVAGRSNRGRRRVPDSPRLAVRVPLIAPVPALQSEPAGHTVAGAVRAASLIVAMEPALVNGDDTVAARLVSGWAAPSAFGGLMAVVRQERAGLAAARGGPYRFEVAPLSAKVSSDGRDAVTVQLWCAEVVFADQAPRSTSFVTESLHLVWQPDGWRLTASEDTDGPVVPMAASKTATTAEETASALAGFEAVGPLENGD